jgi:transposase
MAMKRSKTHKLADVALLQLGSDVHAALEAASQQSGYSKSEFVRLAVQGAIQDQEGYWERLLIQVLCSVPELMEAAADAGLLTQEEAKRIVLPMDQVRQRLYGELDRIDGLASIHWVPRKGDPRHSYEEVMRTRASRDELVRPEIASLERLRDRFAELAARRLQEKRKTKPLKQESNRPSRHGRRAR